MQVLESIAFNLDWNSKYLRNDTEEFESQITPDLFVSTMRSIRYMAVFLFAAMRTLQSVLNAFQNHRS